MLTPTRWNPVRDLFNFTDEINPFSRDFFDKDIREASLMKGTWNPSVDISEDDNNFYLNVELPGMKREDVKVNYDDGLLTVSGERKTETENKDKNYLRVERTFGKFERSFRIPTHVIQDKIDAQFENGVLLITLPKAEEAKPKQIEVKIK